VIGVIGVIGRANDCWPVASCSSSRPP